MPVASAAGNVEHQDDLQVGIERFDQDHRRLFGLADEVIAAAEAGESTEVLRLGLDKIVEESLVHFETEELAMSQFDYPGLTEHRVAHDQLLRTCIRFKAELRFRRLAAEEITGFIVDWLAGHIVTVDRETATFLRRHGMH